LANLSVEMFGLPLPLSKQRAWIKWNSSINDRHDREVKGNIKE